MWQCRGRGKQRKASDGYQGSSRASLVAVGGFLKIMSRTLFSPAAQGSDCRGAPAQGSDCRGAPAQGSDCRGASALQLRAVTAGALLLCSYVPYSSLNIANLGVNWPKVAEEVKISYI